MTRREQMTGIMNEMSAYYGYKRKRVAHFVKVWGYARQIGLAEGLSDDEQFILEITALMHDIGIKPAEEKFGSTAGPYQEAEGPGAATPILEKYEFTKEEIARICYLIAHHHTYTDIKGMDYQILVEADYLVNLDEHQLERHTCESVRKNIFRTEEGTKLLDLIFLGN